MKLKNKFKKIFGIAVCAVMCFALSLPVLAAGEVDAAAKTAAWLKEKCPEPAVGDENVVLALLRGGYIIQQEDYTNNFVLKLMKYWEDGGGVSYGEDASYAEAVDQAFFLEAAGIDIEKHVPKLKEKLSSANASNTSLEERCKVLTYISSVNNSGDFPNKDNLINGILGVQEDDGGFGSPMVTALAIQALSSYSEDDILSASVNAQFWIQLNDLGYGNYGDNGEEDPVATAEVIIAMSCLNYDPEYADPEGASVTNALISMSSENGGYGTINESAKALLALVSKTRYDKSLPSVYNFKDVSPVEPVLPAATAESSNSDETGSENPDDLSSEENDTSRGGNMEDSRDITENNENREKKSGFSVIIIAILIVIVAFVFLVVLIQLLKGRKK